MFLSRTVDKKWLESWCILMLEILPLKLAKTCVVDIIWYRFDRSIKMFQVELQTSARYSNYNVLNKYALGKNT